MGRVVEPVIGAMPRRADGRGRPWRDRRGALNGSLWILRTRARWADLPARARLVRRVLEALAADLNKRGASSRSRHASATARLSPPKRGRLCGKGQAGHRGAAHGHSAWAQRMAMADRAGLPRAVCAASAAPRAVGLVAAALDSRSVARLPQRRIGDRAYDADPLDEALSRLGVESR